MDENKNNMAPHYRGTLRPLVNGLVLVCALFTLSGCGMDIIPTRSMEGDIENAKSHMKKPKKATREEVAQALKDAEDEQEEMAVAAPAAEVEKASGGFLSNVFGSSNTAASRTPQRTTTNVNPKNLFSTDLRSNEDRLGRLERSVQDLRYDFDSVRPSIKRLMAIEGDIQSLITELKKLNDDPSLASTKQSAFQPSPTPNRVTPARRINTPARAENKPAAVTRSMQNKTPPPVQDGKASIFDIRVGEHPGKTRIVLDANTKTSFDVDIDNGEKIMVVELPNANWSTKNTMNFGKSSFITSFSVEPAGNGSMAIFQLKRNAKIGYKADLDGKGNSRRLVIDLVGG